MPGIIRVIIVPMVYKNGPLIAFDREFTIPQFFFGPVEHLRQEPEDTVLLLTQDSTSPALRGRGEHQCARGESHDRF